MSVKTVLNLLHIDRTEVARTKNARLVATTYRFAPDHVAAKALEDIQGKETSASTHTFLIDAPKGEYISVEEAHSRYDIEEIELINLAESKTIEAKISGKKWLISSHSLVTYIQNKHHQKKSDSE